ncbi:MAG: DUF1571 domain-containing protein [Aquabacterium sp.]
MAAITLPWSPHSQAQDSSSRIGSVTATKPDWLSLVKHHGSEGVLQRLESQLAELPEYELWMHRQERLPSGWNEQAFVNYIKYRHQPRQVYMKWLPGGPKAGQEILYDETRRKDAMYGHLAGILNVTSIWTALDGSLARSNSMHSVRDAGLHAVVQILRAQLESHRQQGRMAPPVAVDNLTHEREPQVALTWVTPTDAPKHQRYAARTRIVLINASPWIRQVESWNEHDQPIERIVFERLEPAQFSEMDFSPRNQSYRF